MKKILKAIGNVVIIKQKKEEVKNGIVIPKSATEGGSMELFEGDVIAVGKLVKKFKKGDHVIFGKNVFAIHKRYGEEYLFIYDPYIPCMELTCDKDYQVDDSEVVVKEGD